MDTFELISAIKSRPLMFLVNFSIYEFDAFLRGYQYYKFSHLVERTDQDIEYGSFKEIWLRNLLVVKGSASYIDLLISETGNQSEALKSFFEYWDEFVDIVGRNKIAPDL